MTRAILFLILLATTLAAAAEQKTIKDQVEYDTYMAAMNTSSPAQKAALMEAFAAKYPQSVVKDDALDLAIAGYYQAENQPKAEAIARQIIATRPDNYRALLVLAIAGGVRAVQSDTQHAPAAAAEAQSLAEHVLQVMPSVPLPEGVTSAEFEKQKTTTATIMHGFIGFGFLQKKDFVHARDAFLLSDLTDMQNMYRLAFSELQLKPVELAGYWHLVKALKMAEAQNNAGGAKQIGDYGKAMYKHYHGKIDGWDAFVSTAAGQSTLPPAAELEKLITRAPTPCEIAVQAVNDAAKANTLSKMPFGDRETVLENAGCSPANKAAADQVWQNLQEMQKNGEAHMRLDHIKVIAATATTIDAALTTDNQQDNNADLHIVLDKPLTKPPTAGALIDVSGFISDYTPSPFRFTMTQAEIPVVKKQPVRSTGKGKKKKKK